MPRRKPRLKVVGRFEFEGPRPLTAEFRFGGRPFLLTVWPKAVWDALEEWERPGDAGQMSDGGYCLIEPEGD